MRLWNWRSSPLNTLANICSSWLVAQCQPGLMWHHLPGGTRCASPFHTVIVLVMEPIKIPPPVDGQWVLASFKYALKKKCLQAASFPNSWNSFYLPAGLNNTNMNSLCGILCFILCRMQRPQEGSLCSLARESSHGIRTPAMNWQQGHRHFLP